VLVAVEGHWLAVVLQVRRRRSEVVEGRLRRDEKELHESAGGVVDVHEQGALGAAVLEPRVRRTVDLNELAEAVAAFPRLVRLGQALILGSQMPARTRTRRTVSLPTLMPWSSRSFSRTSVGPKSSYWVRTSWAI
jgi:hypothetical protein